MDAQVIETENAMVVILWKVDEKDPARIPTPAYVQEASELWKGGFTGKEIASQLGIKVGKQWNAHTEWINRLRLAYPTLFPYRREQQKK